MPLRRKAGLPPSDGPSSSGEDRRNRFQAYQDQIRDPSLSALFVLELAGMFFAVPLAARGLPVARVVADTLVLAAVAIVVLLSHRRGASVAIVLGLAAFAVSRIFGAGWPAIVEGAVRRGGEMIAWSAVISVVIHAVYAPGRITFRRLQGAAVVYLGVASLFASAYGLIWASTPGAFTNLYGPPDSDQATAELVYFSLTTLTTAGFGDILAVDPFARSLANLESVIGVFYIGITVARLVTLELADRRR